MGKIEINEGNYVDYQEFLDTKNNISTTGHPITTGLAISLGAFALVFGCIGLLALNMMSIMKIAEVIGISSTPNTITTTIGMGSYIGILAVIGIKIYPQKISKHLMKKFLHKHPDFDMSLSKEKVEKELEKYYQLSKVPKNIEEKKEEHSTNYRNDFETMTAEEKLSFLEQERKFWEQVRVQEKYQDDVENKLVEKESVDRINASMKPKEKAYHI